MDFALQEVSPELKSFHEEVRRYVADAMRGGGHLRWSATWSTRENEEEYQFRRRLARKLGERGWLFPTFPTEYGGAGLTADHQAIIEAELDRYGLDRSHVFYTLARIVAPCILQFGTEQQKLEFLPGMTRGEVSVWQVLTEPQSGSDVANCQTKAIRDGDVYVVSGQKSMVGSVHPPDFMWVLVYTDPGGKRHENLGWIYMPGDLPGITFQHLPMLMGIKNIVFFDDVRVPAKYLVGGENNGWTVSSTHMELEHGGAGGVGGDPAVERLVEYCENTRRAGKAAHRGPGRSGHPSGRPDRSPRREAVRPTQLLAPPQSQAASLWWRAIDLLPAYGASQERRASAADSRL